MCRQGNKVDFDGNSFSESKKLLDTYRLVTADLANHTYKNEDHLKLICKKILEEYDRSTTILPCHLAAYAAFHLIKEKYTGSDIEKFCKLSVDEILIDYEAMQQLFSKLVNAAIFLEKEGRFFIEDTIKIEAMPKLMDDAIKNLGIYHNKRPLLIDANKNLITQDLGVLIYYSNRLKNYELDFEKFIK
jgi:glycerol-3-phosphate O-acyltransferase